MEKQSKKMLSYTDIDELFGEPLDQVVLVENQDRNKIVKSILVLIGSLAITYIACAYVLNQPNPAYWSKFTRLNHVLSSLAIWLSNEIRKFFNV